jgi:dolichyl-phosphate-mannose--protein O-mannosyl transferase
MNFSLLSSLVASSFILLDNSLVTEGRFILSDGVLHFFCCLNLLIFVLSLRNPSNLWLFFCGLSLGAACSCKNTAWGLILVNGITHFFQSKSRHFLKLNFLKDIVRRAFFVGIAAFSVFIGSFAIHIIVLPYSGSGDLSLDQSFQSTLINGDFELWGKRVKSPGLLVRVYKLLVAMHETNMGVASFHAYESRPITWPLLTGCHTAFWVDKTGDLQVNCNGNVFVYVLAFYGIVVLTFCSPFNQNWAHLIILLGYYVSYLPFFWIKRAVFLYHYHIPLFFACMAFGAVQDLILNSLVKVPVTIGAIVAALKGFVTWYPFVYETFTVFWRRLEWDDRWMYGDEVHRELEKGAWDEITQQPHALHMGPEFQLWRR